jgi:hypothetical protein
MSARQDSDCDETMAGMGAPVIVGIDQAADLPNTRRAKTLRTNARRAGPRGTV